VKIIGVEPASPDHKLPGLKRISGLRDDLVPKILDPGVVDEIIAVPDDDAYHTAIQLAKTMGLLVGPTTGAVVYAALKYGEAHQGLAVTISPDDALKYVSFFEPYVKDVGRLAL
jgi:cysteine synthase